MKLESIFMSDAEVLRALTMFVEEKWDDGMFHLISTESIAEDGMDLRKFLEAHDKSAGSLPVRGMSAWAGGYDDNWLVYVLHTNDEVCGMIAITDYQ